MKTVGRIDRKRGFHMIRTTLAQLSPRFIAERATNMMYMEHALQKAQLAGSHVTIFPELMTTGYAVGPHLAQHAEPLDGPTVEQMAIFARRYSQYIVLTFPEVEGEAYYITTALISPEGEVLGSYRKIHLRGDELDYFTKGTTETVIDTPLGTIGLMTSYDAEFPETARNTRLQGADILFVADANMEGETRRQQLFGLVRAMENRIPVVNCNRVGKEQTFDFGGESFAVSATGEVLCELGSDVDIQTVDVPFYERPDVLNEAFRAPKKERPVLEEEEERDETTDHEER